MSSSDDILIYGKLKYQIDDCRLMDQVSPVIYNSFSVINAQRWILSLLREIETDKTKVLHDLAELGLNGQYIEEDFRSMIISDMFSISLYFVEDIVNETFNTDIVAFLCSENIFTELYCRRRLFEILETIPK